MYIKTNSTIYLIKVNVKFQLKLIHVSPFICNWTVVQYYCIILIESNKNKKVTPEINLDQSSDLSY